PVEKIFAIANSMRGKMPMSVGTGSSRVNALKSLEDIGASDWWVTIMTGSDDVKGKPSPDIFLACAEAMDVKPEDCLVFEDGKAGIEAAISAGMPYIDVTLHL
ncbi:HAD-IA family hydrolase, partial [Saprospiraceae bacterium]|nr:HAD-IA family hydrolase [Saprospiraceae bacterium]